MNDSPYYHPIHVEHRRKVAARKAAREARRRARRGQGRMAEWRPNFWAVAASSTPFSPTWG